VLPQVEVVALDVEEPVLVLAQAVERFASTRLPFLPDVQRLLALDIHRFERPTLGLLCEHDLAQPIEEREPPGRAVHPHLEGTGREHGLCLRGDDLEGRLLAALGLGHPGLAREEGRLLREEHADHVGRADLELQSARGQGQQQAVGPPLGDRGVQDGAAGQGKDRGQRGLGREGHGFSSVGHESSRAESYIEPGRGTCRALRDSPPYVSGWPAKGEPMVLSKRKLHFRSRPMAAREVKVGAFASGAGALGTLAIGSMVVGAFAMGALAIGALAIGRLRVGKARLRRLEIDDLYVRRLRVAELEVTDALRTPSD
jgi:hypothetical protein